MNATVTNDPRRVEVQWLDSMSEGQWMSREVAVRRATRQVMLHRSIGYLIHEDDDLVLLAGGRSDDTADGNYNVTDTMQIPRVAVIVIRDLSPVGAARR